MRRKIRAAGQGPDARGEADPDEPRLRHPPRAAGERLLRGLQPAERAPRRRPRDADRADHPDRRQDQRRRTRGRHDHLRHRLRRHHRRVRPHRHPRRGRPAAPGQVGGRAAHLSRPADRGLPQPVHAGRAAQRRHVLQHPALHRAERGLGDRAHRAHARRRATRASRPPPRPSGTGPSTCTTPGGACCSPRSIPG